MNRYVNVKIFEVKRLESTKTALYCICHLHSLRRHFWHPAHVLPCQRPSFDGGVGIADGKGFAGQTHRIGISGAATASSLVVHPPFCQHLFPLGCCGRFHYPLSFGVLYHLGFDLCRYRLVCKPVRKTDA